MTSPKDEAAAAVSDAAIAIACLLFGEWLAKQHRAGAPVKAWTPLEDELLRQIYGHYTNRELVAIFRRSQGAVKRRAYDLGVQGTKTEATTARQFRDAKRNPNWRGFKKGNVPKNQVPIGTEVLDTLGYKKRKVREGARPASRNFDFVHVLLWEKHHGQVPSGHAIVFINGDKTDIRIQNLECISRRELMRRNNRWKRYPDEVNALISMKGALTRRIRTRSNDL